MQGHNATGSVFVQQVTSVASHLLIFVVSGAIAFSLPRVARQFLLFWAKVEQEKFLLMCVELTVAALLIFTVPLLRHSLKDRRLARIARAFGT